MNRGRDILDDDSGNTNNVNPLLGRHAGELPLAEVKENRTTAIPSVYRNIVIVRFYYSAGINRI
jgi:hypothetical protein